MLPSPSRRLTAAVTIALDVTVLRVGWVPPAELVGHLTHPSRWVDTVGTDGATLELARVGLWLAALWLAVAVLVVLVSELPGTLGRMGRVVAGRAVPAVLRRTIVAALGASVVLVPIAAGASTTGSNNGATPRSTAATAPAPIAVSPVSPGPPGPSGTRATPLSGAGWPWPTSAPTSAPTSGPTSGPSAPPPPAKATPGPASAAPAKPVPWPHSAPTRSAPKPRSDDVVVGAGDCLWAIAAHRLGPTASAPHIAAETQRWYQANAATIGADPGLIHPGQHLHRPTEEGH